VITPLCLAEIFIIFAIQKSKVISTKCKQPKRDTGTLHPQEVEKILERPSEILVIFATREAR
jgi:hypothetical protein